MTRAERAQHVSRILDRLFPTTEAPLAHEDPFTLLVAVVLSAQCTDKRVNEVTPALFRIAATPERMAATPRRVIEDIIRPCGLAPAKSRHLIGLSRLLIKRHAGQVPRTFTDLEALPGVGHKTASVVMWQAFGVPAFPVDTHIHRLARRWRLSRARNVVETERDLKRLFPESLWGKRHLQFIFHGRAYCPARGCDAKPCPICERLGVRGAAQDRRVRRSRSASLRARD